jgi:hypothetical protein
VPNPIVALQLRPLHAQRDIPPPSVKGRMGD